MLAVARALVSGPVPAARVTKVIAFNESHVPGEPISESFRPEDVSWIDCHRRHDLVPWKYRLEIRYLYHGVKYRIILRPGEPVGVPTKPMGLVRASRLVEARWVWEDGREGPEHDVTARVRKYLGPEGDFHLRGKEVAAAAAGVSASRFTVRDMFPSVDHWPEGLVGLSLLYDTGRDPGSVSRFGWVVDIDKNMV